MIAWSSFLIGLVVAAAQGEGPPPQPECAGRPGPVMTISIGGAVANGLLNYALIKGWFGLPHLGLAGIGLLRFASLLLRVLGNAVRYLGMLAEQLYDLPLFIPLWLEAKNGRSHSGGGSRLTRVGT